VSESKRDRFNSFLDRRFNRAIRELHYFAINNDQREAIRQVAENMRINIQYECSGSTYDWLELCDIFDWKKRNRPQ
jgi:hypothetical protein